MNISTKAVLLASLSLLPAAITQADTASAAGNTKVWKSSTFLDRVDGKLTDGGANTYVAADGTVRLINLTDLNGDGNIDLVAPPDHTYNQVVDLSIFWGKNGLAPNGMTGLPEDGGAAIASADLNGDGYVDLVVANRGWNAWRPIDTPQYSYIYWGGPNGYSRERRTQLSAEVAFSVAIADLDHDGSPDIIFANVGSWTSVDWSRRSYVYWGNKGHYDEAHRSILQTEKASGVIVADLNGDGYPDVAFAEQGNLSKTGGVLIYWGGPKRSDLGIKSSLLQSGDSVFALAAGDLNHDGFPDLVVANEYRTLAREGHGIYAIDTNVNLDSYIYWGSRDGYSEKHRTSLPTMKASGVAIADLNGDGLPDIVFSNAAGGVGYGAVTGIQTAGDSVVYWNSPDGFHHNHRTLLPTIHATGCGVGDVNGDGFPDVVFSNDEDGKTYDINSYVYLGGPDGLSAQRRLLLPTHGSCGVSIADLDGDGKPEVIFGNVRAGVSGNAPNDGYIYWGSDKGEFSENRRQVMSMFAGAYSSVDINADGYVDLVLHGPHPVVYWGGPEGYTEKNSMALTTTYSFQGIFADFNRDGYLDFLPSEWSPGSKQSNLYYGGPSGYAQANRFSFNISGERLVAAADLNNDGWLDVIYPTFGDTGQLVIYWGGPEGFDNDRKTELPVAASPAVRVADLNRDGFLDLVVSNLYDPLPVPGSTYTRHAFGGSTQGNTFIYWGGPKGFSATNRTVLPTVGNEDVTVADFNNDGLLDIVAGHYSGSADRKQASYLFWNSPTGFDPKNVTLLETDAACGVMSADFNLDGYRDIRFANHVKDGDHHVNTFIYWGGPEGFSKERRAELPAPGNHFLNGVDIGNIYDRSDRYGYISPPFDVGGVTQFGRLEWQGETPFRTRLEFQIRTAPTREALEQAPWTGPTGAKSYYRKSGEELKAAAGRWIQYQAILISPNDANTPVLRAVSIFYR